VICVYKFIIFILMNEVVSWKSWFIIILLSIIWGSSFILIKKSLIAYSPEEVGALRLAISAIAFIPIFLYLMKEYDRKKIGYFIIVALSGSGIPSFLYAFAQTRVDSSVAGVLNSMTPIFALLISVAIFKDKFRWGQLGGVALGFAGASVLVLLRNSGNFSADLGYSLLIVLATVFYGISVNVVNYKLDEYRPLLISSLSFVIIAPFAIGYLFTTDFMEHTTGHPYGWSSLAAVTTLSLLSTFFATILFYRLVKNTNAVFGSSVSFLIPIVALAWGFLDGELLGFWHLVSLVMILLGIYWIKRGK